MSDYLFNPLAVYVEVKRTKKWSRGRVTHLYVEDVFVMPFYSKYADVQQKITLDTSCGKSQTFHCSKVTTMESLRFSTGRVGCDFLLKIGCLNFLERLYIKENKQTVRCNQPK